MQIEIHSHGFSTTASIRGYAERRIKLALNWGHVQLRRITVHLSDENGPKGGKDKRCLLQLGVDGGQDVVVRDTEPDLYLAIDRAVERAARTLSRQLKRKRQHSRDRWEPGSLGAD